MPGFYESRRKYVEDYIDPLLEDGETLEMWTVSQSPGYLLRLIFELVLSSEQIDEHLSEKFMVSPLICLTTRRLIISPVRMLGNSSALLIDPASEANEIRNILLSDILRIEFVRGNLVGKLIIDVKEKGELKYDFISRQSGNQARK